MRSDQWKDQCLKDFDGGAEKRDGTVGGGLYGVFPRFGNRDYGGCLPDGRDGVLSKGGIDQGGEEMEAHRAKVL